MGAHALTLTWASVINQLREAGPDAKFRILAEHIGHPLDAEMLNLDTESDGSYIDYGHRVTAGVWCVVRQYSDAYDVRLVHLKQTTTALVKQEASAHAVARRSQTSIADLPTEAPGFTVALGTALGALAGGLAGGGKGAAVGALIGGSAGLAAVGVSNAASSPETAQAAQTMFLGLTTAASGGSNARRTALLPTPPRQSPSRTERFDSADFEVRRRKPKAKK